MKSWDQQASPVQNFGHQTLLSSHSPIILSYPSSKVQSQFVRIPVSPLILKLFIISSDRTLSSNTRENILLHSQKAETEQTPELDTAFKMSI